MLFSFCYFLTGKALVFFKGGYFAVRLPIHLVPIDHPRPGKNLQCLGHVERKKRENVQLQLARTPLKPTLAVTVAPKAGKDHHRVLARVRYLGVLQRLMAKEIRLDGSNSRHYAASANSPP